MSMWIYSGFGKPRPKISRCAAALQPRHGIFRPWSAIWRDNFIRLFRLWEHALDVAQATAAEKQKLLEEAALSEGALRKQETEALCERFIAAES